MLVTRRELGGPLWFSRTFGPSSINSALVLLAAVASAVPAPLAEPEPVPDPTSTYGTPGHPTPSSYSAPPSGYVPTSPYAGSTTSESIPYTVPTTWPTPYQPTPYPSEPQPAGPEGPKVAAYRAAAVKEAFEYAWNGYYKYAFPNDELHPLDNSFGNSR